MRRTSCNNAGHGLCLYFSFAHLARPLEVMASDVSYNPDHNQAGFRSIYVSERSDQRIVFSLNGHDT
jgi:hypothetical protein